VGKMRNVEYRISATFKMWVIISAELCHQLFWYSFDCKAVATCQIPDIHKAKPNPYLNTNPNANPNPTDPTSILSKDSGKKTLPCIQSKVYQNYGIIRVAQMLTLILTLYSAFICCGWSTFYYTHKEITMGRIV